MEFVVREGGNDDVERIVLFNQAMARETEGRDLEELTIRAGVEALLADPSKGRYFLAVGAGDRSGVAGQLMVTPEWSDWRNGPVWWIQSVYVAPAHRRRGVYRLLHEHVREAGRAEGATDVERALIEALHKRYTSPAPEDRGPLEQAYADAMREVLAAHPDDADVAALAAEAVMMLRPWKLWTPDGTPAPETPEIRSILERDEPVGRRLDFLMQELNREANTLASKSNDTKTTKAAVELKVLIEQMREQVQNIE